MTAYYNEIDRYCCEWLAALMNDGQIPPGFIDNRSIEDVHPNDLKGFDQCHFFAGLGGWAYALKLAGWDGPVWTGSCPCQPFSQAGVQRGARDERHLWPSWFRLIEKQRPLVIFGEQVAGNGGMAWLDHTASDLEDCGYTVGAVSMPSNLWGAQHARQRLWFVANALWNEQPRQEQCEWEVRRMGRIEQSVPWDTHWSIALARFRAMDDGISRRVEATDAARNAIVPETAAAFIAAYMDVK